MKLNTLALIGMLGAFGASAQAQDDKMLLMIAQHDNYTAQDMRILLEAGADVNFSDPWDDLTALMLAARDGAPEKVKVLLNYGADVNARAYDGSTALMLAAGAYAYHSYTYVEDYEVNEVMKLLLDAGADVNLAFDGGGTALMIAKGYGTPEQVRMLQDAGAQ